MSRSSVYLGSDSSSWDIFILSRDRSFLGFRSLFDQCVFLGILVPLKFVVTSC
jgi:hypothetical protein